MNASVENPASRSSQSTTRWFNVKVAAKRQVALDIHAFDLVPLSGGALPAVLPAFTAGAHLDVLCGDLVKQYSLCSSPADGSCYTIAVQHERNGRGGSAWLCGQIEAGATVSIKGPVNHFPLRAHDTPALLVAGGIGITPLLAMADELYAQRRDFKLHYLARSRDKVAFSEVLEGAAWASNVHLWLDNETPPVEMKQLVGSAHGDRHLYVCGPAGLMHAVLDAAGAAQWPSDHLHTEYFAAAAVSDAVVERAFTVQVASTGARAQVGANETIVTALARIGVRVPISCEQGVCGSCITRVLGGVPDHRDYLLSDAERAAGQTLTPCCSRSLSDVLILDL